jgi:hypothetical protein
MTKKYLAAKKRQICDEGKPKNHYEIAKNVIEEIGADNIIYQHGKFYIWNQHKGVWECQIDPHAIRDSIVENCFSPTAQIIASVLEIISIKKRNDDQEFNNCRTINCLNGEIQIDTDGIKLLPHDRKYYSTNQIPVRYEPNAVADTFDKFLSSIFRYDIDELPTQIRSVLDVDYEKIRNCVLNKAVSQSGQTYLHIHPHGSGHGSGTRAFGFTNKFVTTLISHYCNVSLVEKGKSLYLDL